MIVYIPTPITSMEQAAQLPARTVAQHPVERPILREHGRWRGRMTLITDAQVVADGRWEALVPIEAKEETISVQTRGQAHPDRRTRLTTPWKWLDGPSPDRRGDCA